LYNLSAELAKLRIPNILEVIYAPQKALKKMAENPTIIAPILVIAVFAVANLSYAYVIGSKVFVEQTVPNGLNQDEWTQNSTLWISNAQMSENSDVVNGSAYLLQYTGNTSLAFSSLDTDHVWMKLDGIGTVDCSNPNGYDKLSFRVKWTSPTTKPINVTVQLFSNNSSESFFRSLDDDFANSTYNAWTNETILLASENWFQTSSTPTWNSITGLGLEFTWAETSNQTVLIDGLFFHGPMLSEIDLYGTSYLLSFAYSGVMQFVIKWIILSGVIYLMTRSLGGKLVWRVLLIMIGTTLITMAVLPLVNAIATSTISSVNYPFELITGFRGEAAADEAYNRILDRLFWVDTIHTCGLIIRPIWTAILCSVAVHVLAAFSWRKSFLVGATVYVVDFIILSILFGF